MARNPSASRSPSQDLPGLAHGDPFGARSVAVNAYPTAMGNYADSSVGYGTSRDSGFGTIFRERDRGGPDMFSLENLIPGRSAGRFDVYNPRSGGWDRTAGESTGSAAGEIAGTLLGLALGVPGLGALFGAGGSMLDPWQPRGVDPVRSAVAPDARTSVAPPPMPGTGVGVERTSSQPVFSPFLPPPMPQVPLATKLAPQSAAAPKLGVM